MTSLIIIFNNRLIILSFILQLKGTAKGVNFNLQSPWCYSGQEVGFIKRRNVGAIVGSPCIKQVKYKMVNQNLLTKIAT